MTEPVTVEWSDAKPGEKPSEHLERLVNGKPSLGVVCGDRQLGVRNYRRPNPDHRFRLQMGGLGGAPILAKTRSGQTPLLEPRRGFVRGGKMREAVSLRVPVLSRAACWSPPLHSPLL